MTSPFSGIGRRRFEPDIARQALRQLWWNVERHARELWGRGKRNPRMVGMIGAVLAITLGGTAYALSASSNSLCPPADKKSAKGPPFLLLMDSVPQAVPNSALKIHYDVCGLQSGAPYKGKVRISQRVLTKQKKSKKSAVKTRQLAVSSFEDKVDGPATRRLQQVELKSAKPGKYTLELVVTDSRGRQRKKVQKIVIKAPQ